MTQIKQQLEKIQLQKVELNEFDRLQNLINQKADLKQTTHEYQSLLKYNTDFKIDIEKFRTQIFTSNEYVTKELTGIIKD